MKFSRNTTPEPEINLIPFIDVLLVVLIFVMMSASFSKFNELELNLPSADGRVPEQRPAEILVSVNAQGHYSLQRQPLGRVDTKTLAEALSQAARPLENPVLIIQADARSTHQSVVQVLEAARRSQLHHITFATQGQTASGTTAAVTSPGAAPGGSSRR
ncbi:MAG: biopolymer transporter ExbD [Betaproteobacteria bacterium]|nr:biopolymer transporter ExbD [Betaproteobacteria bacterium]